MSRAGTSTSCAQVQHSGYEDSWAPAKRSNASFLAQAGTIDGLTGFDRGLVLDLNPVVDAKATGAPGPNGWAYTHPRPQIGGNVRWGVTNNLTLNGTANPDFAEVESDAGQFVIDPRQALFFPEKRPFFLEGLEQFNVPHNLIYTRRIAQPDAAVEAHRQGRRHERRLPLGERRPVAVAERPRRDATTTSCARSATSATQSRIGMAYTDRVVGGDYNRVADVDGRIAVRRRVLGRRSSTRESYDKTGGVVTNAPLWERHPRAQRQAVRLPLHDDRHRRGLPRAERLHLARRHRARRDRSSRHVVQRARLVARDAHRRHPVRRHVAVLAPDAPRRRAGQEVPPQHERRSARRVDASAPACTGRRSAGTRSSTANYRIERTVGTKVDTVPFTGVGRIPNRDYVFTLDTPQWSQFDAVAALRRRAGRELLRVGAGEHRLRVARR